MPTIPDLNTDNVSFIGYYSVSDSEIDGTFDPHSIKFETESTDRLKFVDSETFTNGVRAEYKDRISEYQDINEKIVLRAGNENSKWITAHMKDYSTENGGKFTQGSDKTDIGNYTYTQDILDLNGEYNLMPWAHLGSAYQPSENILFNLITKGLQNSGFWNRSELNYNNAGLYNYSINDSQQNTSIFSAYRSTSYGWSYNTFGCSFTDTTTIHKAYLLATYSGYERSRLKLFDTDAFDLAGSDNIYFAGDVTDLMKNNNKLKYSTDIDNAKLTTYTIIIWS